MKKVCVFASVMVSLVIIGWCSFAAAQCAGSEDMKKVMGSMKTVTTALVDADQKLGEKKPDSKEIKPFQANAAKLGMLNRQLFTMLSDKMCKQVAGKLNKGVSDLRKNAEKKDSNGMHDGISQIRATCSECHGCAGL